MIDFQHAQDYGIDIFLEDTDATGVVYHASYFRFFERARTYTFCKWGISHQKLIQESSLMFVVHQAQIKYLSSLRFGDTLNITTRVQSISPATIHLSQEGNFNKRLICELRVKLACVTLEGKPHRIPCDIYQKLKDFE